MSEIENKKEINMEEKILEVAERLFLDKGFAKTSTTEIAKEAGCNHAMVHYYFRTKEKLFLKIFENKIAILATAFYDADNQTGSFEEKLKKKISAHFDILAQNPKLPMLALSELTSTPERINLAKKVFGNIPQNIFRALDLDLKEEIAKGRIRPITSQDLLMNIISLNIFLFISLPLFKKIIEIPEEETQTYIEHRKQEIIETILKSLKP